MADHIGHDPVTVAAAADRGGRLADVLAACTDCVALLRDLRALVLATPTAAIPRRPRDLHLTIDDARRLRRRGWHRILVALGTGRDAVTRPLALGLTTLGFIGLLLGSVPAGLPLAGAASPEGAVVDTTQPLRTTDLPGGEVAGAPDLATGDTPTSQVDPMLQAVDGGLLRVLSLTLLGLGLGSFAVRVGLGATQRAMMRSGNPTR